MGTPTEPVKRLRDCRKLCGISREDLAAAMGTNPKQIGHWETGERMPRLDTYNTWKETLRRLRHERMGESRELLS